MKPETRGGGRHAVARACVLHVRSYDTENLCLGVRRLRTTIRFYSGQLEFRQLASRRLARVARLTPRVGDSEYAGKQLADLRISNPRGHGRELGMAKEFRGC